MDLITLAAVKQLVDKVDIDTFVAELNNVESRFNNIATFSENGVIITTTTITNNNENEVEE